MNKIDLIIDALENAVHNFAGDDTEEQCIAALAAARELKAELAKPEQAEKQEPVAWMVRDQVDGCRYPSALKNPAGSINGESQPLYAKEQK